MEGKRWSVMFGERIEEGRGRRRSVGRRGCRVCRAVNVLVSGQVNEDERGGDVLRPSLRVRSSGGGWLD